MPQKGQGIPVKKRSGQGEGIPIIRSASAEGAGIRIAARSKNGGKPIRANVPRIPVGGVAGEGNCGPFSEAVSDPDSMALCMRFGAKRSESSPNYFYIVSGELSGGTLSVASQAASTAVRRSWSKAISSSLGLGTARVCNRTRS